MTIPSHRFELYIEGHYLPVTRIDGLTSHSVSSVEITRQVSPGGGYLRRWAASGDERSVGVNLYRDDVYADKTPAMRFTFTGKPLRHTYSALDSGEEGVLTEELLLHCQSLEVHERENPMELLTQDVLAKPREEEPEGGKTGAITGRGPARDIDTSPGHDYEIEKLVDAPGKGLPETGCWISVSGGRWKRWNRKFPSGAAAWAKIREWVVKDPADHVDNYRTIPVPAGKQRKPNAGELPVQTVIRTLDSRGCPYVYEKENYNSWSMTGYAGAYTDSEIQARIDSRETAVLYRPS